MPLTSSSVVDLLDAGLITQDEFQEKKTELMGKI